MRIFCPIVPSALLLYVWRKHLSVYLCVCVRSWNAICICIRYLEHTNDLLAIQKKLYNQLHWHFGGTILFIILFWVWSNVIHSNLMIKWSYSSLKPTSVSSNYNAIHSSFYFQMEQEHNIYLSFVMWKLCKQIIRFRSKNVWRPGNCINYSSITLFFAN